MRGPFFQTDPPSPSLTYFHGKSPKIPENLFAIYHQPRIQCNCEKNPKFPSILKSHWKLSLRPFLHWALQFYVNFRSDFGNWSTPLNNQIIALLRYSKFFQFLYLRVDNCLKMETLIHRNTLLYVLSAELPRLKNCWACDISSGSRTSVKRGGVAHRAPKAQDF